MYLSRERVKESARGEDKEEKERKKSRQKSGRGGRLGRLAALYIVRGQWVVDCMEHEVLVSDEE